MSSKFFLTLIAKFQQYSIFSLFFIHSMKFFRSRIVSVFFCFFFQVDFLISMNCFSFCAVLYPRRYVLCVFLKSLNILSHLFNNNPQTVPGFVHSVPKHSDDMLLGGNAESAGNLQNAFQRKPIRQRSRPLMIVSSNENYYPSSR